MKRFAAALLTVMLLLSVCAPSAGAAVVNHALYTDIVAKINGHPLRSYNIDGWTYVVAEDLRGYGFYALWNPEARTLHVTRASSGGRLELPWRWPDYDPGPLTHRVGERAKKVYSTDIKTYVAGSEVRACNIDGETLIRFDDLAPYGAVVWNEQTRVIELTLADDPMQLALDSWIKSLESVQSFTGAYYELLPAATGTLYTAHYEGLPHGPSTLMRFVKIDGEVLDVAGLLPPGRWGPYRYLNPRGAAIDEFGERLTFITPIDESLADGSTRYWGDTLCTVDLRGGKVLSLQPLAEALTDWSCALRADDTAEPGESLLVTVRRDGAAVETVCAEYPGPGTAVSIDAARLSIVHEAALFGREDFWEGAYGQTLTALFALGLPDPSKGTDGGTATSAQREAAGRYLRVTLNGEPLEGDLRWGRGNNHFDLICVFDAPAVLRDGDELTVSLSP